MILKQHTTYYINSDGSQGNLKELFSTHPDGSAKMGEYILFFGRYPGKCPCVIGQYYNGEKNGLWSQFDSQTGDVNRLEYYDNGVLNFEETEKLTRELKRIQFVDSFRKEISVLGHVTKALRQTKAAATNVGRQFSPDSVMKLLIS
jgi:hypothetical protein